MQTATQKDLDLVKSELERVVRLASTLGVIATVSQVPAAPLAMGAYDTVVDVRAARTERSK